MRLLGVEFDRYRRLAKADMRLEGRITAIVGPNEAGKTSFLRAIERLNDEEPFQAREDLSRGLDPFPADHPVIKAWYALDDDDKALLAGIPRAEEPTRFIITKRADGPLVGSLDPRPTRNLPERAAISTALTALAGRKWAHEETALQEAIAALAPDMMDHDRQWETERLDALAELAGLLNRAGHPEATRLAARLDTLVAAERLTHPNDAAAAILLPRRPLMAWFGDEQRSLLSEYDLAAAYPISLQLLASLAGLDLAAMRAAVDAGDFPQAENLLIPANERLKEVFEQAWRRSTVSVRFQRDGLILRILVSNEAGQYTSIAERSDGLRAFVALVAFLRTTGDRPVVLLIDEAESHLHYDAQADLVRVLTRQQLAQKVIYTTHSAGCLPEDLGLGVRAIEPTAPDRSTIKNFIWTSGAGFSPLIFAMGASITAVTPTRQAVIAEGVSDAVLLPAMIREATGEDELGYQIAPGLATFDPAAASDLELEAPRVAYLVDGNGGGTAKRTQMIGAGVRASRVVTLGETGSELTVEDLLKPDLYLSAVNSELETWSRPQFPAANLPSKGRAATITAWCKARGFTAPSKITVASRVLEATYRDEAITMPSRRRTLKALNEHIRAALAPPSPATT
jgi:predicted ATP-dependent endonuclease of OLD family